ncbi:MAG TPA: Hpt domain-containing protein, partial [Fervidobacterium sp.]|nr:Hpt domain-containing protein [Fervidobacterium sp.]
MGEFNEYLSVFIDESKEYVQLLNESLLELEKNTSDMEQINRAFRALHTLKGMAGTMGFEVLAKLCHRMESYLDGARSSKIKISSNELDFLFAGLDMIDKMIQNIVNNGTDEIPDDVNSLASVFERIAAGEKVESKSKTSGEKQSERKDDDSKNFKKLSEKRENKETSSQVGSDSFANEIIKDVLDEANKRKIPAYNVVINLQEGTQLKSARMYMVFHTLEELGVDIIKSIPSVEDIEAEKFDLTIELMCVGNVSQEKIYEKVMKISEIKSVIVRPIEEKGKAVKSNEDEEQSIDNGKQKGEEQKKTKI